MDTGEKRENQNKSRKEREGRRAAGRPAGLAVLGALCSRELTEYVFIAIVGIFY